MSVDPHLAGARLEALLEATASDGPRARARAEELVREVVALYGAGLATLMDVLADHDLLSAEVLADLAADDLVSSLLLVHGLHPLDARQRVDQTLGELRRQGIDVRLTAVEGDGTVHVALGTRGCGSTMDALAREVRELLLGAVPDLPAVEVTLPEQEPTLISAESLTAHLRTSVEPSRP